LTKKGDRGEKVYENPRRRERKKNTTLHKNYSSPESGEPPENKRGRTGPSLKGGFWGGKRGNTMGENRIQESKKEESPV